MTRTTSTTTSHMPLRAQGMLAGEVAKGLGIGVQTLHYYEREGRIPPAPRSASGYRLYTPDLVERVRFVRKAQALDLPLEEIREVLGLVARGASPCVRVQAALAEKLAEVDRRLRELTRSRDELAALVARGVAGDATGPAGAPPGLCAIVEEARAPDGDVATVPLGRRRSRATEEGESSLSRPARATARTTSTATTRSR